MKYALLKMQNNTPNTSISLSQTLINIMNVLIRGDFYVIMLCYDINYFQHSVIAKIVALITFVDILPISRKLKIF